MVNFFRKHSLFFLLLISIVFFGNNAFSAQENTQKSIAFLPFTINSANEALYLKQGIHDMLTSQLAASANLQVVDKNTIDRAIANLKKTDQSNVNALVGRSLNTDYWVAGSILVFQENVSLDLKVYSKTGVVRYFHTSSDRQSNIIKVVEQLAQTINQELFKNQKTKSYNTRTPVIRAPVTRTHTPRNRAAQDSYSTSQTSSAKRRIPYASRDVTRKIASLAFPDEVSGVSGFIESPPISAEAQTMDVIDLDGDGRNEIIFAGVSGVSVYRRSGDSFKEISYISLNSSLRMQALTVADIDNDGTMEIYVSAAEEDMPQSFALTFKHQKLDFIFQKAPWYIKMINLPGEGSVLLGQQGDLKNLLASEVYRLEIQGSRLIKGKQVILPEGVNLFNFAQADLDNDSNTETISIDSEGHLNIFASNKQLLWRSKEQYGDGEKLFSSSKFIGDTDSTVQFDWKRMAIPARIVVADVNADGLPDIVINRNISVTSEFFEDVESSPIGSLHGFTWTGSELLELWHIDDFDGYISDYQMQPLLIPDEERPDWFRAGGELTVSLVKANPYLGSLLPKKTTLMVYNLDFSDK